MSVTTSHRSIRSEVRPSAWVPAVVGRAQGPVGGADVTRVNKPGLARRLAGRSRRNVGLLLCVALLALAVLTGCASGSASARGARVVVVEHDFGLVASPMSVRSGTVTLHIVNRGPSTHELNVDESSVAAGALPLRANSLQVNEDADGNSYPMIGAACF